jgi:hypothetical protein|tara:strand:+ start:224 stop:418 length:195 start_codon:yes stop_codon:yes gene_type:complete
MNPVFTLLNNSRGTKLGVKTMAKTLGLRKKDIFYYCFKDSRIRRVQGQEVGSGKNNMSVFTIDP